RTVHGRPGTVPPTEPRKAPDRRRIIPLRFVLRRVLGTASCPKQNARARDPGVHRLAAGDGGRCQAGFNVCAAKASEPRSSRLNAFSSIQCIMPNVSQATLSTSPTREDTPNPMKLTTYNDPAIKP